MAHTTQTITVQRLGPLGPKLGAGGQGTVYALPTSPTQVYKAYKPDALDQLDTAALTRMVELPAALRAKDRAALLERAAWPTSLVVQEDGRVSGFLMAAVPPQFQVRLQFPRGVSERLGQAQLLLNDKQYLDARQLTLDDPFRLEFLHDVAHTLQLFHTLDIVVGDLSPNNLLFSQSARPRCYFIDCDAMQVHGETALPQIETPEWAVPAGGEPLGTRASDAYKLALLSVRLFAGEQSSLDAAATRRAGRKVHKLTVRGLKPAPTDRPGPQQWLRPLTAAGKAQHKAGRKVQRRAAVAAKRQNAAAARQSAPKAEQKARRRQPMWGFGPAPWPPTMPGKRPPRPVAGPFPITTLAPPYPTRSWGRPIKRSRMKPLIIAMVLLSAVACAGPKVITLGRQLQHTIIGRSQANSVANLLESSASARTKVKTAVGNVASCKDLANSASTLATASKQHQESLTEATALNLADLVNGAALHDQLVAAFSHSKGADDAYRQWVVALTKSGCRSPARNGGERKRGDDESALATTAKKQIATMWSHIGPDYGYPTITYDQI